MHVEKMLRFLRPHGVTPLRSPCERCRRWRIIGNDLFGLCFVAEAIAVAGPLLVVRCVMAGNSRVSLPTFMSPSPTRLSRSAHFSLALTFLCCTVATIQESYGSDVPLFAAPQPTCSGDEIFLLSTREIGADCNDNALRRKLRCERVSASPDKGFQWLPADWRELLADSSEERPTIIYIHGNRVSPGEDKLQGLRVYHSLLSAGRPDRPVRFLIWSWPSTPIRRPIKDYKVKADLTRPVAWQLAWFLDQFPAQADVSLVGYSYGARVASGSMHLLGGGSLGRLKLDHRSHPQQRTIRAAFLAAAFDANWLQPGHFHSRMLSQIDHLIVATNSLDPAMRFYHLSNGRGHVDALGKAGVAQPRSLGPAVRQIEPLDFTSEVGRSHLLVDYLAASQKMQQLWRQLLATAATGGTPGLPSERLSLAD